MDFSEALKTVQSTLEGIGSNISGIEYDGLIVKKLESSNTLDDNRSTNQTHIAITGSQMDFFPYVRADGYFDVDYSKEDSGLKKYFIAQIPVYIHAENVEYLQAGAKLFSEKEHLVHVSIVRSRRNNAADQIQMSMTNIDSSDYVKYRKLVHAKTYMVLLKRKQKLMYDLYSVKESDADSEFQKLNNGFFKKETNTPVKLDEVLIDSKDQSDRVLLPFSRSKDCARLIVDCIYELDGFDRIKSIMKENEKNIKILTDTMGGNYLRSMFAKSSSQTFNAENDGKVRVFTDKDYSFQIEGNDVVCRLSTEWVSTDLGKNGDSANYLLALISIVNERYAGFVKIYEESGKWYLETLPKSFLLERLPEMFKTPFAKRFITSLLAKPFVILTGNSGTGKTRISKQFAEYLETQSVDGEKNWVLVPVGADWTDNTKILGFYNPLADGGRGKYEKTEILKLIEQANANKDKPYFIILDEMNLSHVERYFADFLSHMETEDIPFVLDGYEGNVDYPSNVFVVGTVNIDETTYMFSPKVLDRANVIEFKPDEDSVLDLFLTSETSDEVFRASVGVAETFLSLAKDIRAGLCNLDEETMKNVQSMFRQIYEITNKYGFEFAFRSVKEIRQYLSAAYELVDNKDEFNFNAAIDEQLVQKILPKIHGNKREIGQLLEELAAFCDQNHLELSSKKIMQMKGKLATVQYASFI